MIKCLSLFVLLIAAKTNHGQNFMMLEPICKNEVSAQYSSVFSALNSKTATGAKEFGKPAMAFGVNVFYTRILKRYFSIQTGITYNSIDYELRPDVKSLYNIHLDYIHIPVLFTLNTDVCEVLNFSLYTGPQFGRNINAKLVNSFSASNKDSKDKVLAINNSDFGLSFGASADVAINSSKTLRIECGGRGSFGFANISQPVDEDANLQNIVESNTTINTFGGFLGLKFAF